MGGYVVGVALAGCFCAACAAETRARPVVKLSPWDAAVKARDTFEAEPAGTHTKAEYSHVMDDFRAIYHSDPGDTHAARAVEQVAELLTEQGHELHDAKSLKDAAGQYEFLAKAYPSYAKTANAKLAELEPAEPAPKREAAHVVAAPAVAAAKDTAHAIPVSVPEKHSAPNAAAEDQQAGGPAMVTGIRHWSTSSYTRVAIDLGDEVEYQAARVENPDRIFFDLHHAKLASQLVGKSFAVTDDGFLTRIRAAQYSEEVTRVVLDVHEVGEYSAFLLPNPYRLIIDIHGKPGAEKQISNAQAATSPEVVTPSITAPSMTAPSAAPIERHVVALPPATPQIATQQPISQQPAPQQGGVEISSLPPMPVTDGGAGFGLPARTTPIVAGAGVPQPRVVISSKPTVAKPVPNTVASDTSETDVAAVSDQPGKVVATNRPTSQPIVSRNDGGNAPASGQPVTPSDAAKGDHYKKPSHANDANVAVASADISASSSKAGATKTAIGPAAGQPATGAPPTADGETSLMRALGLKIGRIVIDAGHGGHDSGTLGAGGIEEKDVVLDVALRLGKLLHDRLGSEIVYTRSDDTFIPLETRTAIANKAQADLFISVHANSSQDATARGVEVYYLNFTSDPEAMRVAARENAVSSQSVHELSDLVKKIALKDKIDESRELASDVDASLYGGLTKGNQGLKDRGVKKAPFVVLIGANMPSILAEISFVTNPDDADQLRRPEYRERVAESLYAGVARYASGINGQKEKTPKVERASAKGR